MDESERDNMKGLAVLAMAVLLCARDLNIHGNPSEAQDIAERAINTAGHAVDKFEDIGFFEVFK